MQLCCKVVHRTILVKRGTCEGTLRIGEITSKTVGSPFKLPLPGNLRVIYRGLSHNLRKTIP